MRRHINSAIKRLRDRRSRLRRRLEELFNREVFSALLVLSPAWKATELAAMGRWVDVPPFVVLTALGVLGAVYWHRLAQAASDAADAVEEATEG